MQKSSTTAFRICRNERHGLEEAGRLVQYGEQVSIPITFWQWPHHIQIEVRKPLIRYVYSVLRKFDLFTSFGSLAWVALFSGLSHVSGLAWPVVLGSRAF